MGPAAPHKAGIVETQKALASAARRLHHACCDAVEAPGLPYELVNDASPPGGSKCRLRDAWTIERALDPAIASPEPRENAT